MDYNLKLSWFDEPAGIDVPTDSACVDREWCAPSVYSEIVGVDFGKQGMCTYAVHSSKAHRAPLNKETEWFLSLPPGTLVVGEWAHLAVPQTEIGRAHV